MNNKNNIRNKTNKLGMIVVVIAAATMVAIAPAMVTNVDATDADGIRKLIKDVFAKACSEGGPASLSCAGQMPPRDSNKGSAGDDGVITSKLVTQPDSDTKKSKAVEQPPLIVKGCKGGTNGEVPGKPGVCKPGH